ncbi:RNA polymerase sigma factor [Zunongwangia sp.]|uniref:RNA polymerase sigma factor n=1 Tax=Zunongwangia sp. TaxID=1965325 RepID=UPI003AA8986A
MKESTFLDTISPFKDKIFRLASRLLVSKEAAEDATQEVIIKLWKKKKKINEYNNIEAFAMTITKNYCYDQLKLKQNNNLRIVHTNYDSHEISSQRKLELKDDLEWISEIMNELPKQQQTIFQLRDIEQYNLEEIAKIMEMKNTAVRVALSRARKKIKNELIKKHSYGVR